MHVSVNDVDTRRKGQVPQRVSLRIRYGTMMSAIRCCELIRYANSSLPRRVEYLNEFLVKFYTLKLLLRVCRDRKLINIQTTADIIEMVTSVEKQILGWRNFTASQEEKAASVKPGSCSSR